MADSAVPGWQQTSMSSSVGSKQLPGKAGPVPAEATKPFVILPALTCPHGTPGFDSGDTSSARNPTSPEGSSCLVMDLAMWTSTPDTMSMM